MEPRTITVEGLRTRVLVEDAHGAAREPIVLIHGVGGWAENWRPVMAALASTGHQVIALDLPGFGQSERPRRVRYFGPDDAFYPRFVTAAMDALGIERAHIAGNSMGGTVAYMTAGTAPARARPLILVAPGGPGRGPGRRARGSGMAATCRGGSVRRSSSPRPCRSSNGRSNPRRPSGPELAPLKWMKTGTRPDIAVTTPNAKLRLSAQDVIADYRLAVRSRAASELSRREVLVGNAPFGISGEGKEVAQLGMAHAFRAGDWPHAYYRDQTFMFAVGLADLSQYFGQLYADPDVVRDPNSAGRQMLSHFATRILDERGRWKDLLASGQSASELSPVGAQMPRSVGLAWASKLYRDSPAPRTVARGFSQNGEEVCFATIGNAGT